MPRKKPAPIHKREPNKVWKEQQEAVIKELLSFPGASKRVSIDLEALEALGVKATKALESIGAELPEFAASHLVMKIVLETIIPRLCEGLKRAAEEQRIKQPARTAVSAEAGFLIACMHESAVALSKALLDCACSMPQAKKRFSKLKCWPVLLSTDPTWDIRKVVNNPEGPAAKRYAPLLGKR